MLAEARPGDNQKVMARTARTPFMRLALWTTALTYALILVGSLVRASGAGTVTVGALGSRAMGCSE